MMRFVYFMAQPFIRRRRFLTIGSKGSYNYNKSFKANTPKVSAGCHDDNLIEEEDNAMPYYVILSNLTDEGRRTIKQKPERILEVNREIETMGVKIHKQYALLGSYDFVNIVEAPDNETVMKMSVEIGSRGSVHLMSLPAISIEEFIKKIK